MLTNTTTEKSREAKARERAELMLSGLPPEVRGNRVLSAPQAAAFIGLSEKHLRRLTWQRKFPQPIRLSARRIGWKLSTLVDALNARESAAA